MWSPLHENANKMQNCSEIKRLEKKLPRKLERPFSGMWREREIRVSLNNNCFIIHWTKQKKMFMFVLACTPSWPEFILKILKSYLRCVEKWRYRKITFWQLETEEAVQTLFSGKSVDCINRPHGQPNAQHSPSETAVIRVDGDLLICLPFMTSSVERLKKLKTPNMRRFKRGQ